MIVLSSFRSFIFKKTVGANSFKLENPTALEDIVRRFQKIAKDFLSHSFLALLEIEVTTEVIEDITEDTIITVTTEVIEDITEDTIIADITNYVRPTNWLV